LLFIRVTSAVRATAVLTVLDGAQPTVFDNDIDTCLRVWNRLKMHCFTHLSTFFTWWSHANIHIAKAVRYVCYAIKFTNCRNSIFKKTQIW